MVLTMKEFWGKFVSGFVFGITGFFVVAMGVGFCLSQIILVIFCINTLMAGITLVKSLAVVGLVMLDFGIIFGLVSAMEG